MSPSIITRQNVHPRFSDFSIFFLQTGVIFGPKTNTVQEWNEIANDRHIPSWSGNLRFSKFAACGGVNRTPIHANRGCLGGCAVRKACFRGPTNRGISSKRCVPLVSVSLAHVTSVRKIARWMVIFNSSCTGLSRCSVSIP